MAPLRTTTGERDGATRALHPGAPFARALIVANPIAGRGRAVQAAAELEAGLGRSGIAAEVHLCQGRGDGRRRVRCMDEGVDLVISVGGDGTLREVFDGLLDQELPVAVLPMGTGNVLSLDLGLPRDVDGLLECIAGRHTTPIDVAEVNGQLAFLAAGVGIDGWVVHELEARRRGPITKLSYASALMRCLGGYREPRLEVELDGEPLEGRFGWVLISNVVHYGAVLKLEQTGTRSDGLFDVHLFPRADPFSLLRIGLRGILGTLPAGLGSVRPARSVRVRAEEPVPCQVDGDARGFTPLELEVKPTGRHLIVP